MSEIEDRFDEMANPRFKTHLGDSVVVTSVDQLYTFTAVMVFNEFVGAIDEKARAIFQVDSDEYAYNGVAVEPRRGDKLVLRSRSWFVVDVRIDETATYELRCDAAQEDV